LISAASRSGCVHAAKFWIFYFLFGLNNREPVKFLQILQQGTAKKVGLLISSEGERFWYTTEKQHAPLAQALQPFSSGCLVNL
jgi:hypothetical protein